MKIGEASEDFIQGGKAFYGFHDTVLKECHQSAVFDACISDFMTGAPIQNSVSHVFIEQKNLKDRASAFIAGVSAFGASPTFPEFDPQSSYRH